MAKWASRITINSKISSIIKWPNSKNKFTISKCKISIRNRRQPKMELSFKLKFSTSQ